MYNGLHRTKLSNTSEYRKINLPKGFKGTVARDCQPLVFSIIDPIWAPDSHPKIFSNSVSKRGDIQICMCISAGGYSADSNFI